MIPLQTVESESAEPLGPSCSFNSFGDREHFEAHADGNQRLYNPLNVEIMHDVASELSTDFQNIKIKLFKILECSVASAKSSGLN